MPKCVALNQIMHANWWTLSCTQYYLSCKFYSMNITVYTTILILTINDFLQLTYNTACWHQRLTVKQNRYYFSILPLKIRLLCSLFATFQYIYIFTAASFPEMSIVKKDACLRAKNGQKLDRESLHGVVQPTFHKLPATIY